MFSHVIFDPPFPAEYILLLGAVVACFTVANYVRARSEAGAFRRGVLAVLRLAVVTGMTLVLLRPMTVEPAESSEGRNVFTVLVDGSRSMGTADVDGRPRFDAVREALEASESPFLDVLRKDYDVRFALFSDSLGRAPYDQVLRSQPDDSASTDIATSLINAGQAPEGMRHAGMLLISDGRDNNGNDPIASATYLRAAGVPVWTTTVGTTDETRDLVVTARFDQNFLFRNQESHLNVDVHQKGFDGWYAKVELLRDGEPAGAQQCLLAKGSEHVAFPIREEARGTYRYTVRVEPLAGEADSENNERTVFVQVVDERAKVLLVEAQPYWDSKFLLRALQADPNLEVAAVFDMSDRRDKMVYVTQALPEGEAGGATGSRSLRLPRTREELFRYDCIILGKGVEHVFNDSQIALLKEYVEVRGGGIIFARGKAYKSASNALADIEPLIWEDGSLEHARFELTSTGRKSPIFNFGAAQDTGVIIRELPEMISITRVKEAKSLAVVLAKGVGNGNEEIATISYQRYGKGKVMSIGAAGLWQWAFMKDELAKYDEVYARFWGQMIRWLVYDSDFLPGQDIAFKSDRFSYNTGDAVALIVQSKDIQPAGFAPQVAVTAPSGKTTRLDPAPSSDSGGYYSAMYYPEEEGSFTATLLDNGHGQGEQGVEFTVYANDLETRFVGANPELMAQIAAASGGGVLALDEWKTLPGKLREFERSMIEETKPEDAWDLPVVFMVLVCVLGAEWFIRRRGGLL